MPLTLAIIHEITIAPARNYFPTRSDLSGFLTLINIWWTISSSRYTPNVFGNVIIFCYKKTDFYRIFADWIEFWYASQSFKLTCQTKSACYNTSSSSRPYWRITDDGYEFVKTGRSQSDPINERRFSQYRQMIGGRFLESLREVLNQRES